MTDTKLLWTPSEIEVEWRYLYHERLALLGCYGKPNMEQHEMAKEQADRWKATICPVPVLA